MPSIYRLKSELSEVVSHDALLHPKRYTFGDVRSISLSL